MHGGVLIFLHGIVNWWDYGQLFCGVDSYLTRNVSLLTICMSRSTVYWGYWSFSRQFCAF